MPDPNQSLGWSPKLHRASASLSSGLALISCTFMANTLPNAHSYMFRKIGPNETKSDTGILMELHETSHAWCHWRDAEVHQIHETSLSLRARSAPSPSKWRGQDLNTPSFPIMTTYRYISYYDLCFLAFAVIPWSIPSTDWLSIHSSKPRSCLACSSCQKEVSKNLFFRMSLMSLLCSSIHAIRLPVIACRYHWHIKLSFCGILWHSVGCRKRSVLSLPRLAFHRGQARLRRRPSQVRPGPTRSDRVRHGRCRWAPGDSVSRASRSWSSRVLSRDSNGLEIQQILNQAKSGKIFRYWKSIWTKWTR